jgi:hypothetical protein
MCAMLYSSDKGNSDLSGHDNIREKAKGKR